MYNLSKVEGTFVQDSLNSFIREPTVQSSKNQQFKFQKKKKNWKASLYSLYEKRMLE